jgi:hypothetical protein
LKRIETDLGPKHVWRKATTTPGINAGLQDEEEECIEDFTHFAAELEAKRIHKKKRLSDYCKQHLPLEDQIQKDNCDNCHSLKRLFPDAGQQEIFLLNYLLRFRDRMTTTELFEVGYFDQDDGSKKSRVIYDEDKLLEPPKGYDEIFNLN